MTLGMPMSRARRLERQRKFAQCLPASIVLGLLQSNQEPAAGIEPVHVMPLLDGAPSHLHTRALGPMTARHKVAAKLD